MRRAVAAVVGLLLLGACGGAGAGEADGPVKVGFITVGGPDDLGYNQAVYEGSMAVARAFPDHDVLRAYHVPESDEAVSAMEGLIDQGARIVFATSFGHLDSAVEVARRHPEVTVLHQGGVKVDDAPSNFGTYWGAMHEPVYLAGMAAGAATTTNRLGYVAAFPIPPAMNNLNAFMLGARAVNPEATLLVEWTADWCDPERQTAAAQKLISAGIDVIAQHQDCTLAILEAAEAAGIQAVGYHYDGSEHAPGSWLVGAVWNWSDLYVDMVRTALRGDFTSSPFADNFRGGFATRDNPFVLTEFGDAVPPEARQAIEEVAARFSSGASPFEGPLADRDGVERVPAGQVPSHAEVDAMDWLVDGIVGELPQVTGR
jgi:simple sugar transport system substrate-binding protein/basic membrane protein A